METTSLTKKLGKLGLLERLDETSRADGLSHYQQLIQQIRDKNYPRVQGIGDDFIADSNLYNAVGAIYPLLNRKQRDQAVNAHLNQFDGLNYIAVNNNHTPYIREPLLLADIIISRRLYWPGLKDEKHLWAGKTNFRVLEQDILTEDGLFNPVKVKSDFLVAYALMRRDITPFGDDYVRAANPEFLNRVMKAIVAMRFAKADETMLEEKRNRLYELLPKAVHERIEPLRHTEDWISLTQK